MVAALFFVSNLGGLAYIRRILIEEDYRCREVAPYYGHTQHCVWQVKFPPLRKLRSLSPPGDLVTASLRAECGSFDPHASGVVQDAPTGPGSPSSVSGRRTG